MSDLNFQQNSHLTAYPKIFFESLWNFVSTVFLNLRGHGEQRDEILVDDVLVILRGSTHDVRQYLLELLRNETVAIELAFRSLLEGEGHRAQLAQHPSHGRRLLVIWHIGIYGGGGVRLGQGTICHLLRIHFFCHLLVERFDVSLQSTIGCGQVNVGQPASMQIATLLSDRQSTLSADSYSEIAVDGDTRADAREPAHRERIADINLLSDRGSRVDVEVLAHAQRAGEYRFVGNGSGKSESSEPAHGQR